MTTEKTCDVKGCGKVSDSFFEIVKTEPTRYLIFFSSTDYETKLFSRLCSDHYKEFWESALDLLKGK